MKNILIFGMTENPGGVESFLMSYIRKINRSKFKFGFLCNSYEKIAYEDELISYGCEIYHITARSKDYKKYKREMQQFFKEHASKYDIIWVNVCSLANIDYLKYAKKYGIKRRIIHSHNSMNMDSKLRGLLHAYNKKNIEKYATDFWACSKEAGEWFYTQNGRKKEEYIIIRNAIDFFRYRYNENKRDEYRKKFKVADKFVIGNVGRLQFQKNQIFLLDIFNDVIKRQPAAILWLIGQGEDEKIIQNKIHQLGLEENVKLLGVRDDVPELLQAMDVFLFPSLFEGLPIALLEAQAAGLVSFASEKVIAEESKITKQLQFISLTQGAQYWADKIITANYKIDREKMYEEALQSHYNIDKEVIKLEILLEGKEE